MERKRYIDKRGQGGQIKINASTDGHVWEALTRELARRGMTSRTELVRTLLAEHLAYLHRTHRIT